MSEPAHRPDFYICESVARIDSATNVKDLMSDHSNHGSSGAYEAGSLSLAGAVAMGTGVMIGAGIFALTGQLAQLAGPLFPLAFVCAAVVSAFSAYSYILLASAYPSAGGIGMFLKKAYGRSVMTGGLALLMVLSMIINESLVARTFGTYVVQAVDAPTNPLWVPVLGVSLIAVVFAINVATNAVISRIAVFSALLKVSGVLVFAVVRRFLVPSLRRRNRLWLGCWRGRRFHRGSGARHPGLQGFHDDHQQWQRTEEPREEHRSGDHHLTGHLSDRLSAGFLGGRLHAVDRTDRQGPRLRPGRGIAPGPGPVWRLVHHRGGDCGYFIGAFGQCLCRVTHAGHAHKNGADPASASGHDGPFADPHAGLHLRGGGAAGGVFRPQ